LAAQSTPLAAPIHGAETRRMAGGAKMGRIRIPLVWQAKDGQVSCVFLFGTALGPFTRKLVAYLYAQGECDQATYEKDWIAFGDMLISGKEPMAEYDRIKGVLAAFLGKRTKSELFEIARANGLLIAPVSTIDDVLQNPQFIAREYWQKVESQPAGSSILYPGPFARFGGSPVTFRRRPPTIGEHNREVLGTELGMNEREVSELARKGII
jgi:benzylsuccinate CoA-transferase BbsE subunit